MRRGLTRLAISSPLRKVAWRGMFLMWLPALGLAGLFQAVAGNRLLPAEPPPEAYIKAIDRERARRANPEDPPCAIRRWEGGIEAIGRLPIDECVRMLPAERMKGVWIDAFEGSRFLPGLTRAPSGYSGPDIWLDTEKVHLRHGFATGGRNGRAVLIEFVGRRTRFHGASGHLGLFDYEIVVDRLISARELH